jgi:hypothetical protein
MSEANKSLRAKALAATKRHWVEIGYAAIVQHLDGGVTEQWPSPNDPRCREIADARSAFHSAASPEVILELLDRLERLESELEHNKKILTVITDQAVAERRYSADLESERAMLLGSLIDCRTEAIMAIEERNLEDVEDVIKTVNSTLDILAKIKEQK